MIKLVLYDADGVLIHAELATYELERQFGISPATANEFFKKEWPDILVGKADAKEKLAPYLKKWGWPGTVEEYQKFWFEFEHKVDQKIIDHIQKLRAQGIFCAVATNQDKYRAEYMLSHMGFRGSFDALYASAHLGVTKPAINFFKLILEKHEVRPEEVVFWDDLKENVEAASKLGITARVYTDFISYKNKMEEIMSNEAHDAS